MSNKLDKAVGQFRVFKAVSWIEQQLASPEPTWVVEGLVPSNALTVITGPPKKGRKSWLAYAIAVAAATGAQSGAVRAMEAVPVWYINREGSPKGTARRLCRIANAMGGDRELLERNLAFTHNDPFYLDDSAHLARALAVIKQHHIKLVVIDTLARSGRMKDENSAADMGALIRAVDYMKACGTAVLLVHHTHKAANTELTEWPSPDYDSRGSSALVGAWDLHLAARMYRRKGEAQSARYLIVSGKEVEDHGYFFDVQLTGPDDEACEGWPVGRADIALNKITLDHFDVEETEDENELL